MRFNCKLVQVIGRYPIKCTSQWRAINSCNIHRNRCAVSASWCKSVQFAKLPAAGSNNSFSKTQLALYPCVDLLPISIDRHQHRQFNYRRHHPHHHHRHHDCVCDFRSYHYQQKIVTIISQIWWLMKYLLLIVNISIVVWVTVATSCFDICRHLRSNRQKWEEYRYVMGTFMSIEWTSEARRGYSHFATTVATNLQWWIDAGGLMMNDR